MAVLDYDYGIEPERNAANDPMEPIGLLISPEAMRKVCKLGYPNGGILVCGSCQKQREVSLDEVVTILTTCWPKLCKKCNKPVDLKSKE
jgi:hypothetical protein